MAQVRTPRITLVCPTGLSPRSCTVVDVIAFSIWNALWVLVVTFILIVVLMAMFAVVVDLARDPDLSGLVKVVWMLVLVLLPIAGLLVYVVARGGGMSERSNRP